MPKTNQIGMALANELLPKQDWLQLDKIIRDRGSKYSVTMGKVKNNEELKKFVEKVKQDKKYAKATHNSYAVRVNNGGQVYESKNDDGETGAGMVILRQMQKANASDMAIVVTRWFGGVMLHADRFKHVQDATKMMLKEGT